MDREASAQAFAVAFRDMIPVGFDILARAYGAHWKVPPEDCEKLAIASARVAVKWAPILDRFGEEIALLGCLAMIVWPRALETERLAREAKARKVEAEVVE